MTDERRKELRNMVAEGWRNEPWEVLEEALDALNAAIAERDKLKASMLNQRGDTACWVEDIEQAKALPEAKFLESCRRFRNELAAQNGEFTGGKTIAQLEGEVLGLRKALETYGLHKTNCNVNRLRSTEPESRVCNCGFDACFDAM